MGVSVHRRRLVRSITSFLTLILAGILAGVLWPSTTNASQVDSTSLLKVQLKWLDQAQFAGYYVGTDQGFFNQHNLAVRTMPGSATIDPIASLANGSADVAQASMDQAQRASTDGKRYVNIAQLFQQPGSLLICRTRPGFNSANDLQGAHVIVGAPVAHHANGAHGQQHGERLPDHVVQSRLADLIDVDRIRIAQDVEFFGGDLAGAADREPGAREWMAADEHVGQAQFLAECAHLVLEQFA